MKLPLALSAVLLVSTAAGAADTQAAKPKPCPQGTVATTDRVTGKQACFAMQMMMGPAQPKPAGSMAKPATRPN